ncbi:MAG: NAD-glutamate dehydrogenase [Gammaproteobacteria bacterium]
MTETKQTYQTLKALRSYIKQKVKKANVALLCDFASVFYANMDQDDLLQREIDDLYGDLLSIWSLVNKRPHGETRLKIYNPDKKSHGWRSPHTVIQMSHDDMPFLVDSMQMEIDRLGYNTHHIIHVGGLKLQRDAKHEVTHIFPLGSQESDCYLEAPIQIEIDHIADPKKIALLEKNLLRILSDVEVSVEDWHKMLAKIEEAIASLDRATPFVREDEIQETKDFLHWASNDHFTFLGYREYHLEGKDGKESLNVIRGSGLGVLRGRSQNIRRELATLPPEAQEASRSHRPLTIRKTKEMSTVHRRTHTDCIIIKMYDNDGNVKGERRIIGLWTSAAYNSSPKHIPFLRKKVATIMKKSRLSPTGHAGKALMNILETLPRDDLIQGNVDELLQLGMGIFNLQERRRTRLFIRKDVYGHFYSCLVYVPRERYTTEVRLRMEKILLKALNSNNITFETRFSESVLARVHFVVRVDPNETVKINLKAIEKKLFIVSRTWEDNLKEVLANAYGEMIGDEQWLRYAKAFPAGYKENILPSIAILDIKYLELLDNDDALAMRFYDSENATEREISFKLFRKTRPLPLSDVLPILENMGLRVLREQPYCIRYKDGSMAWINDFSMKHTENIEFDTSKVQNIFQDCFANVWFNNAENDGFNKLVLKAQLNWREVSVLRAYSKYMRQIRFTFSQEYIEEALYQNASITEQLIKLFHKKFDPVQHNEAAKKEVLLLKNKIEKALNKVKRLDHDRIIRYFLQVILATLRTNYYQKSLHNTNGLISFKLSPRLISDMPHPLPLYEIFVYSPEVEGVHLRSGEVARGGLRWSDRREDFRTEVLGLMKAQRVKNAVIVPTGAKGGFVPKKLPLEQGREAVLNEAIHCYKIFIRGLLDITDNFVKNKIIPPQNTVRYDKDDPYLVVAADKGTATFSDIANEQALAYDFWLKDAFASGGKTGYDHKKMAITARGAWESVKRHFRHLNVDTQKEPFSVVGIGDMAGDVFGNGMLLSPHIKLVAAFNHMHIFIDPNPDTQASYEERKRLFNLPRSSWADYNQKLISRGGGIFDRADKSIKVSAQIKKWLGIKKNTLEPNELITALLTAPVDLLWNGGIGTFVKSKEETHESVGDRNNDAIRVDAYQLRCKVVGEGGNLGFTQLARIAFDQRGGFIYTDFIDNSAGVDCSDHEVNLKILLNGLVDTKSMTEKQRNNLLTKMTNEVADLVLHNNYAQTQAIDLIQMQSAHDMELYIRLIKYLEEKALLDRQLEFLPDDKVLLERKMLNQGLTKPEISVLISYCKSLLKKEILASNIPEDSFLSTAIETAFPNVITSRYKKILYKHQLRREIIATQISNGIVNDMGISFIPRLYDETGADISAIVRAYTISEEIFDKHGLWQTIEGLDYKISSDVQLRMMLVSSRLIRRSTRWFLRNQHLLNDTQKTIAHFKSSLKELSGSLMNYVKGSSKSILQNVIDSFTKREVPKNIAEQVACTYIMFSVLDIVEAAQEHSFSVKQVAATYFEIGANLELAWLRDNISNHPIGSHWDDLAVAALLDDIDRHQRDLSISAMKMQKNNPQKAIQKWMEKYKYQVERWKEVLGELRSSGSMEFVMLTVVLRELAELSYASKQGQ